MTVTVEPGIKYRKLCDFLETNGYALHNLPSTKDMSIGGTIATGTHGSGVKNGNLATAVVDLELVSGKGEIVNLTREKDPEIFDSAIVNLGCFGIVTQITLQIQPSFKLR